VTNDEGVVYLVEFFDSDSGASCLTNVFAGRFSALNYCYDQLEARTSDLGDIKFGETRLEHPLRHPDAEDGGLHRVEYGTDGTEWWFVHRCYLLR
jgi:hypothetical protein